MRLLLEAHALLWWLGDDRRLHGEARAAIRDPENLALVSAATAWEIAIKRAPGKLKAPRDLGMALEQSHLTPPAITVEHAVAAGSLPRHHDGPFDRMLVAQAMSESLTIVTADDRIARYRVKVLAA